MTTDPSLVHSFHRRRVIHSDTGPSNNTNATASGGAPILKPAPPPLDPGVFRCVATIRRLIDEASELAMRAASGLSSGSMHSFSPHSSYGSGGVNSGLFDVPSMHGGRKVTMSAVRAQRLRVMAVQKLAAAYKLDEIASSVMVMKGTSALDDLAERILKHEPNNLDAIYVHFFHEKIPASPRQISNTTTEVLDGLISARPNNLEYWRTRGVVHCFNDAYSHAIKDFTHGLAQSRALRKGRHDFEDGSTALKSKPSKKKKGRVGAPHQQAHTSSEDPSDVPGYQHPALEQPTKTPQFHRSISPDAPDPFEMQFLFQRGVAYLAHAIFTIERAVLALERVAPSTPAGPEVRLSCLPPDAQYGGIDTTHPQGPLGPRTSPRFKAYHALLAGATFKEQVFSMLKKSVKDFERFLSHFDSIICPFTPCSSSSLPRPSSALSIGSPNSFDGDAKAKHRDMPPISTSSTNNVLQNWEEKPLADRVELAYYIFGSQRPTFSSSSSSAGSPSPSVPTNNSIPPRLAPTAASFPFSFTTYHPLLTESHFCILLCLLLLGEFPALAERYTQSAIAIDGFDGYPLFVPARSMAQADFGEVLERLADGWRGAKGAKSSSGGKGDGVLGQPGPIEGVPPLSTSASLSSSASTTTGETEAGGRGGITDNEASDNGDEEATAGAAAGAHALASLRILLAPVLKKRQVHQLQLQVARRGGGVNGDGGGLRAGAGGSRSTMIMPTIPLHGPRVDVILAWLGSVHLPWMEVSEK
ncbi:hypothetical protein BS47DRAFT_1340715 [Hydnum rufescens UP504]|uniref:Uncharacterized protein n=1 Tax=Hydnum rufescens UP504 TaxID=1448309 RepID=A0A9P6B436_9AGAM|nr:hypothetical protein BS47DRAFT_1340715 [Hydnum rufescens UP504]